MKTILGTMTFGDQVDQSNAQAILDLYVDSGSYELDTAYQYCEGRTETMLGALLPGEKREKFFIASKVHPWNDHGLQPEQVKTQLTEILRRLGSSYLDLLYLHSPDLDTPIEQTLLACFELYQQGKFKTFGLSNFAAWQVAEVVELCRRNGWMEPQVYQGMYNALTRDVERELFPCLRNYGMRFYAYNPLAGGLLTGKYKSFEQLPDRGRFVDRSGYQPRYWKKEYFGVLQQLDEACAESGLSQTQAAMGWLQQHSKMQAESGDGIILGVSKIEHLSTNLIACAQAPLDASLLEVYDRGWDLIRPNCFRYFRP